MFLFPRGKLTFAVVALFAAHVDNADFGKNDGGIAALEHAGMSVFSRNRVVMRFQGRSGGTENHRRTFQFSAHDGNVPCVVPRSFGLLVGLFVFFIDDDQFQVCERREQRGACTDRDADASRMHFHPFVVAFPLGESAVENADHVAEPCTEPFDGLRSQ